MCPFDSAHSCKSRKVYVFPGPTLPKKYDFPSRSSLSSQIFRFPTIFSICQNALWLSFNCLNLSQRRFCRSEVLISWTQSCGLLYSRWVATLVSLNDENSKWTLNKRPPLRSDISSNRHMSSLCFSCETLLFIRSTNRSGACWSFLCSYHQLGTSLPEVLLQTKV